MNAFGTIDHRWNGAILTSGRPPLTAAELVKHPEFEHVTWDLKPATKGKVAVAEGRGGPLQISYELHGNGPTKLVVGATSSHHFPIFLDRVWPSFMSNIVGIVIAICISEQQVVSTELLLRALISFLVDYGLSRLEDNMAAANQRLRSWSKHEPGSEYEIFVFDFRQQRGWGI